MANENDAVSSFLNEISGNKQDIFKESPQEEVIDEVIEDKPLPFHKDPKVQRYIQKEIEKAKKDLAPTATSEFKESVSADVEETIKAFSTIIGNDTPEKVKALDALKRTLEGSDERASKKAIERFQKQMKEAEQQQAKEDREAADELQAGFEEIEEEHGVDLNADTKTRTAFVEYLKKVSHKNKDGEVDQFADIPSAWETFQERAKAPQVQSRAKQLAARGMTRSTEASQVPTGKSWKDVDRYFAQLEKTLKN